MNVRLFVFGGVIGLLLGGLGWLALVRELHHTRVRLATFEEKEAKMRAHHERRKAFEDALIDERAERSSRRLRDDDQ